MNATATNATTGQTYTFECDIETFATYLADTQYIETRYSDTEIICRDIDGNLDTFTITHVNFTDRLGRTDDCTEEGKAIIDAYRQTQQPKEEPAPQVGDKVEITGEIVYHEADTYMNTTTHFIILKDEAGTSWKLNTTAAFDTHVEGFRNQLGWAKGNTLTLTATIKKVGEYKGTASYTVTRPRLHSFTLGARALEERDSLIKARDSHHCMAHKVEELREEYAASDDRNDVHVKLMRFEDHERFNCPTHRTKTFEYPLAG